MTEPLHQATKALALVRKIIIAQNAAISPTKTSYQKKERNAGVYTTFEALRESTVF